MITSVVCQLIRTDAAYGSLLSLFPREVKNHHDPVRLVASRTNGPFVLTYPAAPFGVSSSAEITAKLKDEVERVVSAIFSGQFSDHFPETRNWNETDCLLWLNRCRCFFQLNTAHLSVDSSPSGLLLQLHQLNETYQNNPSQDWRSILAAFTRSCGSRTLGYSNKRLSARYGTRPGPRIQRRGKIMIAIDTSASVNQPLLTRFFRVIHRLWQQKFALTIVECDFEVRRVYPYCGRVPEVVAGRQGTSFNPALELARTSTDTDGMVYLTDGLGPPPVVRPPSKLLWLFFVDGNQDTDLSNQGFPGQLCYLRTGTDG